MVYNYITDNNSVIITEGSTTMLCIVNSVDFTQGSTTILPIVTVLCLQKGLQLYYL